MNETTRVVRARPVAMPVFQAGILLVFLAGSLLVALFLSLGLYQLVFLNRIYIGVSAMGVELGGMTREQAEVAVARRADEYLAFPVTLRYDDKEWTLTGRQAGAALDVAASVNQAFSVGRYYNLLGDLRHPWAALRHGVQIEPVIRYDTGPANMTLTQIAQAVDRPARDAQLLIRASLSVEAIPAQTGLAVDLDATRAVLHHQVLVGSTAPVDLIVQESSPAITEVEEARRMATAILSGPMTLGFSPQTVDPYADDRSYQWTLPPAALADMLLITEEMRADGVGRIWLAPNQDKWTGYLEQVAAEINRPVHNARFEIDSATGELVVLVPSQTGWTLDTSQALALIAGLPTHPTSHLELPVKVTPPAVDFAMRKTKFTEEQIAFALRKVETGTSVAEVIRKMGITEQTFYRWKKKYGGLGVGEVRELRQLREENRKLKQMVADLSLDKQMLQEVLSKKL